MNCCKILNQKQKNNCRNAKRIVRRHLTKEEFNILRYQMTLKDVQRIFKNNSLEYYHKKAMNYLNRKRGSSVAYQEYSLIPLATIAEIGCIDATKQSLYEKTILDIIRPFGFSKGIRKYIQSDGSCDDKKDGTIKSMDGWHKSKNVCVYHKQWNGENGGSQTSDSNETQELLNRIRKSRFKLIMICTGTYFTPLHLKEIDEQINAICPNKAILFSDQNDPDLLDLQEYLTREFDE
jgi:hypothetical protein